MLRVRPITNECLCRQPLSQIPAKLLWLTVRAGQSLVHSISTFVGHASAQKYFRGSCAASNGFLQRKTSRALRYDARLKTFARHENPATSPLHSPGQYDSEDSPKCCFNDKVPTAEATPLNEQQAAAIPQKGMQAGRCKTTCRPKPEDLQVDGSGPGARRRQNGNRSSSLQRLQRLTGAMSQGMRSQDLFQQCSDHAHHGAPCPHEHSTIAEAATLISNTISSPGGGGGGGGGPSNPGGIAQRFQGLTGTMPPRMGSHHLFQRCAARARISMFSLQKLLSSRGETTILVETHRRFGFSPAPCPQEWEASICSSNVLPVRAMPTMKIGVWPERPWLPPSRSCICCRSASSIWLRTALEGYTAVTICM